MYKRAVTVSGRDCAYGDDIVVVVGMLYVSVGSTSSEDYRVGTLLGTDVEVWVVVAGAGGGSPLPR